MVESLIDLAAIETYFNGGKAVYYFKKATGTKFVTGNAMRVAIYIRVSTKLQENKFSLKAQIGELTRYAQHQGWIMVGIYRDVDSGGKLDKKGLNQLLDDVDDDKADVVLCIDQDRLSRLDTVAWEFLKSQLRDNDVKIAEPGRIVDLANEDDEFISDIKNLIARKEKKNIVKRMMRGKRQRTREGKGWGKPPFEYDYDKNTSTYSINEKWAWVIQFIDDLYLKENLSDKAITDRLNDICKTPTGKLWNTQHVRQRLNSKSYHGVMEKDFSNGETVTVENVYPKLRSEHTWQLIHAQRAVKYQRRNPIYPHILRDVYTTCGSCGKKLLLKQTGDQKYSLHYYLGHSTEYSKPTYSEGCGLSINTIRIEFNLIQAIKDILTSEETAKRYIQFEYGQLDIDQLNEDIAAANKQLGVVQQKLDNLLDLYLDGAFSKDALNTKKVTLENERDLHTTKKRQLEAKKEAIQANMFNYDTVYQYLQIATRFEVELEESEKQQLVGRLFSSGVLYEDKYVLQGNMAGITFEITVPVAENPFGYLNVDGKRKPRRVTKSSLGIDNIINAAKEAAAGSEGQLG